MSGELRPGDLVTLRDWDGLGREVFGKTVVPQVVGKVIAVDEARGQVHFWADALLRRDGSQLWSKRRTLPLANVVEGRSTSSQARAQMSLVESAAARTAEKEGDDGPGSSED